MYQAEAGSHKAKREMREFSGIDDAPNPAPPAKRPVT